MAALEAVHDALVLAVHIGDLPGAHADVAGGSIGELADVTIELGHEALAEAHDCRVALALGVEVGAALAAAHGQGGQGVLQALLKAQELDNREIDRGMEAQAALVGADGGVVLHAVAAVDLYVAVVIHPGDTELNDALGLHKALQQRVLLPLGMLVDHEFQRFEHFPHGLQKFRLMSVTLLDLCINPFQILVRQHSDLLRRP